MCKCVNILYTYNGSDQKRITFTLLCYIFIEKVLEWRGVVTMDVAVRLFHPQPKCFQRMFTAKNTKH